MLNNNDNQFITSQSHTAENQFYYKYNWRASALKNQSIDVLTASLRKFIKEAVRQPYFKDLQRPITKVLAELFAHLAIVGPITVLHLSYTNSNSIYARFRREGIKSEFVIECFIDYDEKDPDDIPAALHITDSITNETASFVGPVPELFGEVQKVVDPDLKLMKVIFGSPIALVTNSYASFEHAKLPTVSSPAGSSEELELAF